MTQETELPHELLYETAESDWGVINEFIEKPGNVKRVEGQRVEGQVLPFALSAPNKAWPSHRIRGHQGTLAKISR